MTKYSRVNRIIALVLPAVILFGNFSICDIRLAGVVLTYYRVLIPVFGLVLLLVNTHNLKIDCLKSELGRRQYTKALLIIGIIWFAYGVISILVFPYASFHEGGQELLALMLGIMAAIEILIICSKGESDYLIAGIKIAVAITLLIGFYEIITANHLSTSRVNDPEFIRFNQELFGSEADNFRFYVAMAVFNNENDFSAMIAVMAPFFFVKTGTSIWTRIVDCFMLCLSMIILYQNNAFICYIAFFLGLTIALIAALKTWKERLCVIASLALTRIAIALGIISFGNGAMSMADTLLTQFENDALGMGSMYYRINTYRVTLIETFRTSKGLGFGAGSFTNYFSQFAEKEMIMVNPHCFWFEILSEYGILIFGLFTIFLVALMIKVVRKIIATKKELPAIVCASGAALVIASVAPSGYLKTGYYWIPIALALYVADYLDESTKIESFLKQ